MKAIMLSALAILAIAGCAVRGPYGCPERPYVVFQTDSIYDLRVQAWDRHIGGPFAGAKITVLGTGDAACTNSSGWTRNLAVPPQADRVRILVEWPVKSCYSCDIHWRSYERGYGLRHGLTEIRVDVDSRPPI